MRPRAASFDVFDTLIARYAADPIDVFYIMELILPLPRFRRARMSAEYHLTKTGDIHRVLALPAETAAEVVVVNRAEFATRAPNPAEVVLTT